MKHIDLNCDMGESFGAWSMGADAEVMPWISSANIACGAHAGDPVTMQRTMAAAAAHGVAVGAHIGLPDREGFGRRAMAISADELYALCVTQIGALAAVAHCHGLRLAHVKAHGALYHMLERDPALAQALIKAVGDVDASLRVVGLAGGRLLQQAADQGQAIMAEAFTDRRYATGTALVSRREPGAVLDNVADAVKQARDIVLARTVTTADGGRVAIHADTLCVHGDRPDAAVFAQALHEALTQAGIDISAPSAADPD